jgi:hypothetical protein
MSELQGKLENLLIQEGKYVSITKENETPVVVDCWFKKDKDTMLMYSKNNKNISIEISLTDIQDIQKKSYKEYVVSYQNGNHIVLKFRDKSIE